MKKNDSVHREPIQRLAVDTLQPFKNHPFRMYSEEKLAELSESIRENGVISPILVRPLASGGYEIVSGHNRVEACKLSGIETIPAIVRDMDDDTAILMMIDANQQRETVLPSEKAFAYKMRLEAMKRQGKRTASVGTQVGYKSGEKSADRLARDVGESRNQIQRYIRLTYLIPELRDINDAGQMLTPNLCSHHFQQAAKKVGLKGMRLHDLRHTVVTYMLDAGENPKTVQEFVGHADPGFMLRQYAHVLEQSKKRASDTLMRTLFGQNM